MKTAEVMHAKHKNLNLQAALNLQTSLLLAVIKEFKMEQQLKEILATLRIITTKINELDHKIVSLNERLTAVQLKFSNRCDDIEKKVSNSLNEMDEMKAKINELEQFKDLHERTALQNESYSKRLNVLIHGVEEDKKLAWESQDMTTQKLKTIMKEGLETEGLDLR